MWCAEMDTNDNIILCYKFGLRKHGLNDVNENGWQNKSELVGVSSLLHLLLWCPPKTGLGLGDGPSGDEGYPLDISSIPPDG